MAKSAVAAESAAQSPIAGGDGTTAQRHTNSIHLSLQGKGGVGKSLIASILAQYFRDRGREIRCIDTDPVNSTMFQYKALGVSRLELLRDGSIDQRGFDALMERLLTEDATFVVDNGAATFIPLWSYILENSVSVAEKKGTKMAAKWSPARGAVRRKPFPLLRSVVRNGPEPVKGAPLLGAAKRTLDGEDRSEMIAEEGKAGRKIGEKWSAILVPSPAASNRTASLSCSSRRGDGSTFTR